MHVGSNAKDKESIRWSGRKSTETGKARRKRLRGVKKGLIDLQNENQIKSYVAGGF